MSDNTPAIDEADVQDRESREGTPTEQTMAALTNLLMDLEMVTRTHFQSENHVETTPNTLTITINYYANRDLVKSLAKIATGIVKNITTSTIKTSIEHPFRAVKTEEGKTNHVANKHIDQISIRWNERWAVTPGDVRIDGTAIDTSNVPQQAMYDPEAAADEIFAINELFRRQKQKELKENNTEELPEEDIIDVS